MKSKLLSIALVLGLLVAALMQLRELVEDRQSYRQIAIQSVAKSLAGAQTLTGPLIHMACTEAWEEDVTEVTEAWKEDVPDKQRKIKKTKQPHVREFHMVAAPASLTVQGASQIEAEPRGRGLHATRVFNLKAHLTAQWADLQALKPVAKHPGSRMNCGQPLLMVAVSDARGIRNASLRLGDQTLALKSGTFHGSYPRGVHAPLPPATSNDAPLHAQIELELIGTEQLSIVPVGSDTQVKLTSNWPHPSFDGEFLPVEHKITDQGFEASWRVSALASTAQQDVAQTRVVDDAQVRAGDAQALGVTFVDRGNTYVLTDRATKYGLLFIALTFVAVGLFELMQSLRVHPIQYFLVGAAMSIFFLLLLSLSEHMSFGMAYAVAAAACVLLLTYYASHMLRSWLRGVPFGLGIGALYGMLFVLLQLQQMALLVGAVALFVVLAASMMLTRRVDWYSQFTQGPVPGSSR